MVRSASRRRLTKVRKEELLAGAGQCASREHAAEYLRVQLGATNARADRERVRRLVVCAFGTRSKRLCANVSAASLRAIAKRTFPSRLNVRQWFKAKGDVDLQRALNYLAHKGNPSVTNIAVMMGVAGKLSDASCCALARAIVFLPCLVSVNLGEVDASPTGYRTILDGLDRGNVAYVYTEPHIARRAKNVTKKNRDSEMKNRTPPPRRTIAWAQKLLASTGTTNLNTALAKPFAYFDPLFIPSTGRTDGGRWINCKS